MSHNSPSNNEPNILGRFASIVALLGVALYFTGWIYRWRYFGFFQLEVTTLDLPLESFLMVPLQVFFGNNWAIAKTFFAFTIAGFLLLIAKLFIPEMANFVNSWRLKTIHYTLNRQLEKPYNYKSRWTWITSKLQSIPNLNYTNFPPLLLREILVVLLVLFILFNLAAHQGIEDAQRDAGKDSTLSVVTLLSSENRLALGRKRNSSDNPSGFRIIGDRDRYEDLLGRETNDPNNSRIWRLLIDRGGYFYIFKSLPTTAKPEERPPVVAVQGSLNGDQLLILSPEPFQPSE